MLKLRTIDEGRLAEAAELLTEGFPLRSLAFWQRGLRRLADHNRTMGEPAIGNFLVAGEVPVGILLTIPSHDPQTGRKLVNLSSWYVKESHRWSAARLMMAALADRNVTYTDFTPTKAAVEVNARFGFRSIGFKRLLLFLPWLAIVGRRRGRLVPLSAVPAGAVPDALMRALGNHEKLGCIVTAIESAGRYAPVVFDVIPRKRIPSARVVYAEGTDVITDNLAALARLLVRRGVPLLTLQVDESKHVPHARVWERGLCYQVRGEWNDRIINELYSERVLLKV
ncbi:hypothetical protein [Shinella sp. BYT-45]|uniref:hypothetical protein n=1 Tax=Shinella sp. BYT-45 TaxID=3377377 RepID=UPI0039806B45